jgi:hypothetical protein
MSLYIFPDTTLLNSANTWTQGQSFIAASGPSIITIGNTGSSGTTCTITGKNFSSIPWLDINSGTNALSFVTVTTGGTAPQQFTFNSDGAFGIQDVNQTSTSWAVQLAANSSTTLTANRKLTFDVVDAARTVKLTGNLTIANNFTTAGNFPLTLTTTASTSVTLPTSGTLLTTSGSGSSLTFGTGTLSLAGNLTTSGAFATTLTVTAATNITLPTTGTLATLANTAQTFAGLTTFSKGVNHGNEHFPTYKINLDFGADVAGTWRRIVVASLANINFSTVGFRIRVVDPNANHATTTSVNADFETYMVACIRTESTTPDTPDNCVVRGPGDRIRAVKTAVGSYEIQIQNQFANTEYQIEIDCYANNGSHTITYESGSTVGSTGTAQYTATVGSSIFFTEKFTAKGSITADGGATFTAGQTVAFNNTAAAPFTVASTIQVTNLNASQLAGNSIGTSGATIPLCNTANTFSANNTFSGLNSTFGSNTGAATYGLGSGATLTATTKTINIGTSGVSGSITNINIGSATSDTTTDMYGILEVLAAQTGGVASNGLIKIHGKDFGTVPATITQGAFSLAPWLVINSGTDANSFVSIQSANSAYTWTFNNAGVFNVPGQIASSITGVAPFTVASNTVVANLNASLLSGNAVGTSGTVIPLLDGTNTFSGVTSFTNSIKMNSTTAVAGTYNTSAVQLQSNGSTGNTITGYTIGLWGAIAGGAAIEFVKGRNGTIGTTTGVTNVLVSGDTIAQVIASGFDATTVNNLLKESSAIRMTVSATPTVGFTPGKIAFWTSGTASASASRVEINHTGLLSAFNGVTVSGATTTLTTGTATVAPLTFASGTNLTTAAAGVLEYDGSFFYATKETTSGRGNISIQHTFRLAANGGAITTIANFYGANSAINLAASSVYDIEYHAYFTKTTAGTVTFTLTASSAPTLVFALLQGTPAGGVGAGTPQGLTASSQANVTTAFGATASLTNNTNHVYLIKGRIQTNAATNLRLNLTSNTGSATPLAGSYYVIRRVSASQGSFAA